VNFVTRFGTWDDGAERALLVWLIHNYLSPLLSYEGDVDYNTVLMAKLKPNYTILAIETSMDDTAAAVTVDDRVLSNVIASQVAIHEEYGGTVPFVAARTHSQWLIPTIEAALHKARVTKLPLPRIEVADTRDHRGLVEAWRKQAVKKYDGVGIDAIAVTYGPGLAPCLEVGVAVARMFAEVWGKPLIAVNHMEAHLLSPLAKNSQGKNKLSTCFPHYPVLGFLISGGHTQLVLMHKLGEYELLGETLDDAAGEAYDKVARMLKLGYPGGPILAELAKRGNPDRYPLPEPMRGRKDLNFSFSGIKTAALYKLRDLHQAGVVVDKQKTSDFAASFQAAVLKMLMRRFKQAIELYAPKTVFLGGGVVSNTAIRAAARKVSREYGVPVVLPYSNKLFTDNAGMIGACSFYQARRGFFVEEVEKLERVPNLGFI
jgi:N6-L-threonylcarbamoyladenine synthase